MDRMWQAWLPKYGLITVHAESQEQAAVAILHRAGVAIRCAECDRVTGDPCRTCSRETPHAKREARQ